MEILGFLFIGGFFLYFIITIAVKVAVKEALHEFKDEVVKEFHLKDMNSANKYGNKDNL